MTLVKSFLVCYFWDFDYSYGTLIFRIGCSGTVIIERVAEETVSIQPEKKPAGMPRSPPVILTSLRRPSVQVAGSIESLVGAKLLRDSLAHVYSFGLRRTCPCDTAFQAAC